jgi:uncharacterized protein YutE (UPF0331/DUF86 family)
LQGFLNVQGQVATVADQVSTIVGLKEMSREQEKIFAYIGICLAAVQMAERGLQTAIETVLDDPKLKLLEQAEPERQRTLGNFLRKLKRRTKVPHHVKEKLYGFLKMRNQLVHDLSSIPGWDLNTEKGRETARRFLTELAILATAVSGLCIALFQIWARDEFDEEFYNEEFFVDETQRQLAKLLGQQFGGLARELLAGASKTRRSKWPT